jgi:hypothetical protein
MAFSEEEIARYSASAAAFCERRVPVHVHHQAWMGSRIEGQGVTLVEYRTHWKDKSKVTEHPIAKTTFNRRSSEWKIYWMRANLKWWAYEPCPAVSSFEEFLEEVDRDECGCFFG